MTDQLIIAGTKLNSRLILGTAGYPNQQVLLDSLAASGAELVTMSIRRISLETYAGSLVDLVSGRYGLLPNTSGCVTARDAILTVNEAGFIEIANPAAMTARADASFRTRDMGGSRVGGWLSDADTDPPVPRSRCRSVTAR